MVLSYSSVMKVACYQAHETHPVTVGEIKDELDHVTADDGANDKPLVPDVCNLRTRVGSGQEHLFAGVKQGLESYQKTSKDSGIAVGKPETNTNIDFQKNRQEGEKFDFSDKVTVNHTFAESRGLGTWAIDRNKKIRTLRRFQHEVSNTKIKIEPVRVQGNSAKNLEHIKRTAKKPVFSVLKRRKRTIDPGYPLTIWCKDNDRMTLKKPEIFGKNFELSRGINAGLSLGKSELSIDSRFCYTNPESPRRDPELSCVNAESFHEDPEYYRLKRAWTREDLLDSELAIIPEEVETGDTRQRLGLVSLQNHTRTHGHLTRMREWMAVRLMNKENSDVVLHRK